MGFQIKRFSVNVSELTIYLPPHTIGHKTVYRRANQYYIKILTLHSCWIHLPYCFYVLIRAEFLKPCDWLLEIADEIIHPKRFFYFGMLHVFKSVVICLR